MALPVEVTHQQQAAPSAEVGQMRQAAVVRVLNAEEWLSGKQWAVRSGLSEYITLCVLSDLYMRGLVRMQRSFPSDGGFIRLWSLNPIRGLPHVL